MVVTKSTLFPLIIWSECFYSLRNFEKYNTVFLTIVNMCMLCPRVGSSHNWKFVPSEHLHPFPLDVSFHHCCFFGETEKGHVRMQVRSC